jgi:site-specific recombinase XerD
MRFVTAVKDFLGFCEIERRLSENTILAYGADLDDFGRWLPAGIDVSEILQATLKDYLAELVSEKRLAVATVRRRFACLRAFFRREADRQQLSNPFEGWHLRLPRRKRLPRTLSRIEASSLLSTDVGLDTNDRAQSDATLTVAIPLMIATGMRVGELCKLRVDDISADGLSIRVQGKGSRDRVVYISDRTLRRNLLGLVRRRLNGRPPAGRSLFLNRLGSPLRPQSVRSKLRRHANLMGLSRRVTPHMLRHTAATLLIETGVDIRFVQRLLGHSSIATTELYTHVSDEALKSTLERADVLGTLGETRI